MLADTDTISFLDLLEPPKTKRIELCKNWLNAVKNRYGVYIDNVRIFEQGNRWCFFKLKIALSFPYLIYDFGFETNTNGSYSPLDDYSFKVPVYGNEDEIKEHFKSSANKKIMSNGNLDKASKAKLIMLSNNVIEQAMEEMKQ